MKKLGHYIKKGLWWAATLVGIYAAYVGISYWYEYNIRPSELINYENEEIGVRVHATKLRGITLYNKSDKQRHIKIKYGILENGCNGCNVKSKYSLMLIVDAKSTFHKPMKKLGKVYKVELCTKHMVERREVVLCHDLLRDEEMD